MCASASGAVNETPPSQAGDERRRMTPKDEAKTAKKRNGHAAWNRGEPFSRGAKQKRHVLALLFYEGEQDGSTRPFG